MSTYCTVLYSTVHRGVGTRGRMNKQKGGAEPLATAQHSTGQHHNDSPLRNAAVRCSAVPSAATRTPRSDRTATQACRAPRRVSGRIERRSSAPHSPQQHYFRPPGPQGPHAFPARTTRTSNSTLSAESSAVQCSFVRACGGMSDEPSDPIRSDGCESVKQRQWQWRADGGVESLIIHSTHALPAAGAHAIL